MALRAIVSRDSAVGASRPALAALGSRRFAPVASRTTHSRASRPTHPVARLEPTLRVGSNACATMTPEARIARTPLFTEGVGFEPTRTFRSNALAGRRLKPLGHPSKAETLLEKRSFSGLPR